MNCVRVEITGRVQGVGYRAWTVSTASKMGLRGWVRNRSNGSVEAVFIGEDESITRMIEACKEGPPMSRVDGINTYRHTEENIPSGFTSKPTA